MVVVHKHTKEMKKKYMSEEKEKTELAKSAFESEAQTKARKDREKQKEEDA